MKPGILVACLAIIMIGGCNRAEMNYRYSDGSGNSYIVGNSRERSFTYRPVKPGVSSSGIYDGGAPVSFVLTAAEYARFESLADAAAKSRTAPEENRVMGSGMLTVRNGDEERTYIFRPDAPEKKLLEQFLEKLRRREE